MPGRRQARRNATADRGLIIGLARFRTKPANCMAESYRGGGTLPRMRAAPPTTSSRRLTRFVPILGWSRSYDRKWLRGDLHRGHRGRGDDRAQGPRLRRHRRRPGRERALCRRGGRDHLRPVLHVSTHLDRPKLVARGRRRRRRPGDRPQWQRGGAARGGDRSRDRSAVPAGRHPQARLARQLPVAGGRDRVPCRRRDRRRHRRAAQAHRNLLRRRECLAGVRVVGSGPGRTQPGDAARRSGCPRRHPRASFRVSEGPGCARPRGRRPGRLGRYSTLARMGSRSWAPVPRGLPLPQVPSLEVVSQNFRRSLIAAFALLLIGFSQTAGDAQAFATKHRYRVDLNQESVAQGMANLGAGVFQGMPVSTSLSASSLNESAGARTPVASLATGGDRHCHADPARARCSPSCPRRSWPRSSSMRSSSG